MAAINICEEFDISYPSSPEEQRKIEEVFKSKSGVHFDKCAGAIDDILIWINKPSERMQRGQRLAKNNTFVLGSISLVLTAWQFQMHVDNYWTSP